MSGVTTPVSIGVKRTPATRPIAGAFGDDIGTPTSSGSDGFSCSGLGHAAYREVLQRLGVPVVLSRHSSGRRASAGGVLVVAEPASTEGLAEMIGAAGSTLLVLPKWKGVPHEFADGWVQAVRPVSEGEIKDVLAAAGIRATLVRPDTAQGWEGATDAAPTLLFPQLLEGDGLVPLLRCREGILLAEFPHPRGDGKRLRVLSDPDVLANHGLGRGDNAAIAVAAVEELREGSGAVFLDETLHGFARAPSFWRETLSFPLGLVTIHALLLAGLVVLAGAARFGAPGTAPAVLEPGKRFLVDNTAGLLALGGHSSAVLVRYWRDALRIVAETLRLPGSPNSPASLDAMDRVARSRGVKEDARSLEARVLEAAREGGRDRGRVLLRAAVAVRAWREEMTRGH